MGYVLNSILQAIFHWCPALGAIISLLMFAFLACYYVNLIVEGFKHFRGVQ